MQILVTGYKGQLGSEIQKLAPETDHDFIFTDIDELDICNETEVDNFFNKNDPDLVINCAAYTAVDKAESEIDKALLLNATAPRILAENCRNRQAILFHISTDFVFSGQNCTPYTEQDPTAPVNVYGQTKLEGENQILKENPRSIIFRTSWLYSSFGNNFVKTMLRLAKERDKLNVIYDQVGTPTYANDLARSIIQILDYFSSKPVREGLWGIYHYSNEGVASWYDFACEIFENQNLTMEVTPVRSREYPTPAARPFFSVLDKYKFKSTFNQVIPHWKESLKKCLELL